MAVCETIKVKRKGEETGAAIIINKEDFDPELHSRVREDLTNAEEVTPPSQEKIVEVIGQVMGQADPSLLTDDGWPTVKALEEILGADISADDRDHAWEAYLDGKAE